MSPSLTPQERQALATLAEATEREDPAFAARLRRPPGTSLARYSPLNWPPATCLVIGLVLLLAGLSLNVGSAVPAGLALLLAAAWRSGSVRRRLARVRANASGR